MLAEASDLLAGLHRVRPPAHTDADGDRDPDAHATASRGPDGLHARRGASVPADPDPDARIRQAEGVPVRSRALPSLALLAALGAPAAAQIPVNPPVKAATPRPT